MTCPCKAELAAIFRSLSEPCPIGSVPGHISAGFEKMCGILAALDAANAENERLRLLLANARSWMRLPASEQHASTIRDFNDMKEAISTALEKTP